MANKHYGMVIDLDKCTGCQACAVACKMENGVDLGVFWERVYRMGPIGSYPDGLEMFYFPNQCMHCENPSCISVCPTKATYQTDDGVVLVDANLTTSKKLHLLWKEMRVGLVNGALLAVMALGFLGCYIHFFKAYAWGQAFLLSGCVGVSLIVAMVISSLVGTVIPMLFHKIHIDPAVASGPLITTINDLVAVVVYYGLAMIVLIDMLHLG